MEKKDITKKEESRDKSNTWKTVIDFTKIASEGVPAKDVLLSLKRLSVQKKKDLS